MQEEYNREHGITPKTIEKAIHELEGSAQDDFVDVTKPAEEGQGDRHPARGAAPDHLRDAPRDVRPAEALEFEKAAALRDRIKELEEIRLSMGSR